MAPCWRGLGECDARRYNPGMTTHFALAPLPLSRPSEGLLVGLSVEDAVRIAAALDAAHAEATRILYAHT